MLRQDVPAGLFPPEHRHEPGGRGALCPEPADDHPAGGLHVGPEARGRQEPALHHRRDAQHQRPAGGDGGTQEPADGPARRGRDPPVLRRTRRARSPLHLQEARAGPLRRGPGRSVDDDAAEGARDGLPALQPRPQPRGRQSARRGELEDPLPLGRGAAGRQPARYPPPLHAPGGEGKAGQDRQGRPDRSQGDDDLPALPPARRRAEAGGAFGRVRGGSQLPRSALGGIGEIELDRLARPPSRQPARCPGREGLSFGGRRHRPARARPAVAGDDLPVRAQDRRRREDRGEHQQLARRCRRERRSSSPRSRSSPSSPRRCRRSRARAKA